ncbi:MAG: 16S rRNA (adenine(1518)-N(6)/adenine(1519)-N(6))-dimethyltransferase RsmA [Anaeromicrobium sp.]|jgi:16S rRNA (adenine1518-N6/adenine1519-N6)-dimethyltransferase|uniref:16S rRNA (adenine(1518)-N(6)/adenine(1519)-N(6))- dimethyltransferase RsmA n=1 Tax=Anaeromicrobium sp. TaxID=1929132 RepID=UPI0025F3EF46|nr:16S rRNA (adenine(1518)-N(6)/adenine(1519)-N(6))-dimethyltransferase RsmA [Anaeromicrobium sp.]MCT4593771.1 16S rRNA (adenine(1518)-N(6)/adenine(1519)-N(6))-dimethyltransferase RsmA [Anaeromicrobium sp.]
MDKLVSAKKTKEIVNKHGFKFSKSLGQNFLIDENILYSIVHGSNVTKEDTVIEVGPGIGTLTQVLCDEAKRVVAIEIDKTLIPILGETLGDKDNIDIVNEDVLKVDIHTLLRDLKVEGSIKLIANLPYYITTPIVMKFLEEKVPVKGITVMIQKEVADRMRASAGTKEYGALSVAVQYYCEPHIITKVPRSVFIPQPKVESTVINLEVLEKPRVQVKDEKLLFKIVRAAFGKRRKTLLNALSNSGLNFEKDFIRETLERAQIDPKRRGETLSIDEFAKLADAFII